MTACNRVRLDGRPSFTVIEGGLAATETTGQRLGDKLKALNRALQLRAKGEITDTALTVFNYFIQAVDGQTFKCRPHIMTVCANTGLAPRTVKRALKQLESVGLIERHSRYASTGRGTLKRMSTVYTVIMGPLQTRGVGPLEAPIGPLLSRIDPRSPYGPRGGARAAERSTPSQAGKEQKPQPRKRQSQPQQSPDPAPAPAAPPRKRSGWLFDPAVDFLVRNGLAERRARALLGKWRKDYGDEATAQAICDASDREVSEPVGWVTAALRAKARPRGDRHNDGRERMRFASEVITSWMKKHAIGGGER
jgi:hypothetical protein